MRKAQLLLKVQAAGPPALEGAGAESDGWGMVGVRGREMEARGPGERNGSRGAREAEKPQLGPAVGR